MFCVFVINALFISDIIQITKPQSRMRVLLVSSLLTLTAAAPPPGGPAGEARLMEVTVTIQSSKQPLNM